jgi:transporter family protein
MLASFTWKTYMILSIFAWGLWSFLGKIVMMRIGWAPAFALLVITDFLVLLLIKPAAFVPRFNFDYLVGLGMALAGTLGGVFFYKAMETGPASVVVPGTALYIVIAAVLAFLLLHEAMTWNRVLGILFGVAAIYFLSRG